jgi:LysR family transcriptional regulator, benzoate and cis,cis-muconate-responsive activator of ben and cat genes
VELRHLATFLAVAEEGQFARAATRLYLSRPAVTAHISSLERELGARLLERSPVELTPAGQRLLPHARAMLDSANAAVEALAELDDVAEQEQTLRVGIMGHGSAELTPAILNEFRRTHPSTLLSVQALDFTEHVTALVEHRVDVAFVRPAAQDDRIVNDTMTVEPRIIVVPAGSDLADASAVYLQDVLHLPFLDVPRATPREFTDYLYFMPARNGDQPRRSVDIARSPHEVLNSVAAGRGAGSALLSFRRFYAWPGTRCVPVLDAPPESSALATRKDDDRPAVRRFRALAGALARDLGPRLVPSALRQPTM